MPKRDFPPLDENGRWPLWPSLVAVAVFACLFLSCWFMTMHQGLDISWAWGANAFAEAGEAYGRDVVFTYGPLAYLLVPMDVGRRLAPALTFQLLQHVLCVVALFVVALRQRRVAAIGLFVLAWVALFSFAIEPDDKMACTLLLVAVSALTVRSRALALVLFALTPAALFLKFSLGVQSTAALGVMVLLWRVRWRSWWALRWAVPVYVLALLADSKAALGSIPQLPAFMRLSAEVARGFSVEMYSRDPGAVIFQAVALLAGYAVLLALLSWRRRPSGLALAVAFLPIAIAYKHTFIRYDEGHIPHFFGLMMAGCALGLLASIDWAERGALVAMLLVTAGTLVQALPPEYRQAAKARAASLGSGREAREALSLLFNLKAQREAAARRTETGLVDDRLPAEVVQRIGRNGVMVVPWEMGFCAANGFPCVPYPTFQMYSTYTSKLDRWTADTLHRRAPRFVLAHADAIDGRQLIWDCPQTWRELLTDYAPEAVRFREGVLLRHRAQPLAFQERDLGTVAPHFNDWQDVPSTSPRLQAHFTLQGNLRAAWYRLAWRPRDTWVEVRRRSGVEMRIRPVWETADAGVWLQARVDSPEDLRRWLEGEPSADPVVAFRLVGPGMADIKAGLQIHWTDWAH